MVLFMIPSLLMPLTTRGTAAVGGHINILFMPLDLANADAPQNLSARILQELQIALAQREGVQVTELLKNSPMMKRALDAVGEENKQDLLDKFNDAANAKLSPDARKNAAGALVRALGVDAIVYGAIDNYEFTTKPDKNRTYIKVTAQKVTVLEDGTAAVTPLTAIGYSWPRPDGKGEQATHDLEAIQAVAQNLALQLTGRKDLKPPPEQNPWWRIFGNGQSTTSVQAPPTVSSGPLDAPRAKPRSSWLLVTLLGLAVVAAVAGKGGNDTGSVDPPPVDDGTGYAYPESDGDIRLEIMKPASWDSVASFQIWRDATDVARGRTTARTRVRSSRTLGLVNVTNRDDAVLQGDHVILYDTAASYGYVYTYRVVIVSTSNTRSNVNIYNGQAPLMLLSGVGPYVPPPVEHVIAPPSLISGGHATLYWYMPGEDFVPSPTTPPTATYAMPSYVTSFCVQIEEGTGGWTTIASGISKNTRSFQVPVPTANTLYRYTVRAVSSTAGLMYPLEALSAAQQDQVIADATSTEGYSPIAPVSLSVQAVVDSLNPDKINLRLNWPASTDTSTTSYKLYRAEGTLDSASIRTPRVTRNLFSRMRQSRAVGSPAYLTTVNGRQTTTYTDTGVDPRKSYVYYVASLASVGSESTTPTAGALQLSKTIPGRPSLTVIPSPVNPKLTAYQLSWTGATDPAVYGYVLLRSISTSPTRGPQSIAGTHTKLPLLGGGRGPFARRSPELRIGRAADLSYLPYQTITHRTITSYVDTDLLDGFTYGYAIEYLYLGEDPGLPSLERTMAYNMSPNEVSDLLLNTSTLKLTWSAPTTNADNLTPITDGNIFRIYRSTTLAAQTGLNPKISRAVLQANFSLLGTVNWTDPREYTDAGPLPLRTNVTYAVVPVDSILQESPGDYPVRQIIQMPDPKSIDLTPVSLTATVGDPVQQLTVAVVGTDNLPLPNSSVTVNIDPTDAGVLSAVATGPFTAEITLTTDAAGHATCYWQPPTDSNTAALSGAITATITGTALSDSTTLVIRPQAPPNYQPATQFDVQTVTGADRVYYSNDDDDQLATSTRRVTSITITGRTATGALANGGYVRIHTDRGGFERTSTNQVVSLTKKDITGYLDANGQMQITFTGKPDDGIVSSMLLPVQGDLGQPALTGTDIYAGVAHQITTGTQPRLIGPPYTIGLSMNPTVHAGWPAQTDQMPVTFQLDTNTVIATVTDLVGQRVMAEMPIWFTQHWAKWQGVNASPYDYIGSVGPANITGAYYGPVSLTDANGTAQAGFSSNHSGTYKVLAYALRKGYSADALNAYNTDTNGGLPDPLTSDSPVLQYLLASTGSGATTPGTTVLSYLSVLNKTLAYYDHWNVKSVSDGTNTVTPPNLYVGGNTLNPTVKINCDGSQAAPITFWATDEDGKKILQGVPFKVSPVRLQYAAGQAYPSEPGGLLQTTTGQSVVGQILSFNDNSEATVASRGDTPATIGLITLKFDNMRSTGNIYQFPDALLAHRGPSTSVVVDDPAQNSGIFIQSLSGETAGNVHVIAGSTDQVQPARNTASIHINLKDASNNDLPAGYRVVVSGYQSAPVTYLASGAGAQPVVSWMAPPLDTSNTSADIIDTNPVPRDATNPNRNLRIRLYGNSWEEPREEWLDQYLIVERPHTLTGMTECDPGYGPQDFNHDFNITIFATDNRVLGAQPVFDGFPIKFGLTKQYAGDATITPVVYTTTVPGTDGGPGGARATFNTGTKPDVLTIYAYYDKNNNGQWDAGEVKVTSNDIRVGTPATVGAIDLQPVAVSGYTGDLPKPMSVVVRDTAGVALPNQLVAITMAPANAGGLSALQLGTYQQTISATTDAAGQASFYWKPGTDVVASGTITATVFGTAISDQSTLTVLEPPPGDYLTADTFDVAVAANNPSRVYFSNDNDDQLASASARFTTLRITGHTAGGQAAAGARVTVTTDRGGFEKLSTDQLVTVDRKQVSGILDTNGQMLVRITGRPDNGTVGMVLPSAAELGRPVLKGQDYYVKVDKNMTGDPPRFVGPPHLIEMSINPTAHAGWPSQAGLLPVTFQIDTNTVRAQVTDLIGQPVLREMPIWFTQHWTKFQSGLTPYDYNGVLGHANIAGAYYGPVSLTDDTGAAQAGFASNHSGIYKIEAFALKRNYNVTALDSYNLDSLNGGIPDPIPADASFLQYLLPSTGTAATPETLISSDVSVLNKTLAYYDNWQVLQVSDGNNVKTTFSATPFDVPPIIINCDGSQSARILFTAQDEDAKKVLPGVPFRVYPRRSQHTDYSISEGGGSLLQLYDDPLAPDMTGQYLSFNDQSEAYVLSRGNANSPGIGVIRLQFDNLRPVQPLYTFPGYLVGHRGPSITEALASSYDLGIPGSLINGEPVRLASGEAIGNLPKTAVLDVALVDENLNPFPGNYYISIGTGSFITHMPLDGEGKATYTYNAPALDPGIDIIDMGPTMPDYNPMRILMVKIFGNPWEEGREDWYPQRVTVERPHTYQGWIANFGDSYGFGATVPFSTVAMNDMLTGPEPVLPGFTVKYGIRSTRQTPSATISASGLTDKNGVATGTFNSGALPDVIQLYVYYDINNDGKWDIGESMATTGDIYIGVMDVTGFNVVSGSIQRNQLSLEWNPVPGATSYQLERTADNTIWEPTGLSGTLVAGKMTATDTGLGAGVLYKYRVRGVIDGQYGNWVTLDVRTVLDTPVGFATSLLTDTTATVSWLPVPFAATYTVQQLVGANTWINVSTTLATSTIALTALVPNTTYTYRVRAVATLTYPNASDWSANWSLTTMLPVPTNLNSTLQTQTSITLDWDDTPGAATYELERSPDGTNWSTAVPVATSGYLDDGTDFGGVPLVANTTYQYRVRAISATNTSVWTAAKSVKTSP